MEHRPCQQPTKKGQPCALAAGHKCGHRSSKNDLKLLPAAKPSDWNPHREHGMRLMQ